MVTANQFGYAAGYYYYAKYLKKYYDITFLCFDDKKDKMKINNVNIIYVPRINKYMNALNLLKRFLLLHREIHYDVVLFRYIPYSIIFKFFSTSGKFILDIRSSTIQSSLLKRVFGDLLIRFNAVLCGNTLTLSKQLKRKLKISNAFVIPLGGERQTIKIKKFERINLLYVGSLNNRNIEITIEGFAKYLDCTNDLKYLSYDIIGDGSKYNVNKLLITIKKYKLEKYIKYHGYVNYEKISEFYEKNNIGVSFIPITTFYESQPPTKTYEYLVSGMPVIATINKEHLSIISDENGILIYDTAEDFYNSLNKIKFFIDKWDYESIIENSSRYEWESIIYNKLLPYIRQ